MKAITPNSLEHGGNIYKMAEELGVPEGRLIDFSASINPLGISKNVKDIIDQEIDNIVNYPDTDSKILRRKIAEHHGIDPDTIICGNGSTELIYLIPRALKPEQVLIPAPTFSEYERACRISSGPRVKHYELKKESCFEIIPDQFINAMQGCDMAFLCNPNNPTGHLLEKDDLLRIAQAAGQMRCCLIVDEAFIDFVPEGSVIKNVQENPYMIVLRSMTKFYALTGLRIGYGVFHKDVINKIKEFKEPWTVNHLAQKTAIAAITDNVYAAETYELIKREKDFIEKGLQELHVEFLPSGVNYYLLRIEDAEMIVSGLKGKGILVRDCSNFRGLEGSYIRTAVRSRSDNEMLLRELSELR